MTERLGGLYTCTVSNNKPSISSVSQTVHGKPISLFAHVNLCYYIYLCSLGYLHHWIIIYSSVPAAPTEVSALHETPTSILVSWSVPNNATGYRITYHSTGGDSGNVSLSGDSTNNHTLTGLHNGETYTISISSESSQISSNSVTVPYAIGLGMKIVTIFGVQMSFCTQLYYNT